jgi:hypothetical protein
MVRLALPGGWVASMEYVLCYLPRPAFARICETFTVAFRRNGADPAACLGEGPGQPGGA